jgi:phosphoglycolate phosphatase
MAIKAILFDKDGTLIDVNRTWVPVYRDLLMAEFEVDLQGANAKLALAGYDAVTDQFRAGSILAGGTTLQIVQVWWPELGARAQAEKASAIDVHYAPLAQRYLSPLFDLAPVFDALDHHKFLLGVGTNDSVASAEGQMKLLGIASRFAAIIGYDSVQVPKPSGQMIALFANKLGLHPQEIAMVGDNTHDLEEARHGGAGLAIGVLTGNGTRDDLSSLADHVIESVQDLPELLLSN